MRRFTREFFAKTPQLHWVDDVVFIPKRPTPRHISSFYSRKARKLLRDPAFRAEAGRWAVEIPEIIKGDSISTVSILRRLYESQYAGRPWGSAGLNPGEREPIWINLLQEDIQAELRWWWVMGEHFEPLAIVNDIPCTGVGYAVSENGMIDKVRLTLNLYRLAYIRQLAALHHPLNTTTSVDGRSRGTSAREIDPMFMGNEFLHTRWCHVLDVHALATLIGNNVGLTPDELRHLRVAAVSHDGRTPAGGDTTKWIDPQTFDEDLHYPDLLRESEDWPGVRDEFGLSDERLHQIIMNQGLLGSILDIADKLAYIGRDVWTLIRYSGKYPHIWIYRREDNDINRIMELGQKHPFVCGIWDMVKREGDQIYFTDAHALAAFLELRCFMFRGVYLSPYARFREHTVTSILLKYLYETGQVTAKQLVSWGDDQLWGHLNREFEIDQFVMRMENKKGLHVYRCASAQEAEAAEQERVAAGDMVFVEKIPAKIAAGGHFLVKRRGRIMPIAEALPKRFEAIAAAARQPYEWYAYSFPLEQATLTPQFKSAIDAYQRRRIATVKEVSPGTS